MKPTVKVAIVGCGAVAEFYYAPALTDLAREKLIDVCALVDPQAECRARLAQTFVGAQQLSDVSDLGPGDAELVIVASPPRHHAQQAIQLLKKGHSVLCEKPLATTLAQARELVEIAAKSPGVAAIGLSRRFLPAVAMIDDILARELLGDIVCFRFSEGTQFRWPVRDPRYFDRIECQGVLLDIGSHALDLVTRWFDQPRIIDYEDDAMGGVEANCRVRLACGSVSGELRLSRDCDIASSYLIQGTRAWLRWPSDYADRLSIGVSDSNYQLDAEIRQLRQAVLQQVTPGDDFDASFRHQIRNVVAVMAGTEPLIAPVDDGIEALALIEQCQRDRRLLPMPWLADDRRRPPAAKAMRVGVLGANGFIGSRLVEQFHLSATADVVPIARGISGLARSARFDLSHRVADALDVHALRRAFQDCDAVVHTIAGDVNTITGSIVPVYRAAQDAGVKRIVYLSSASVHGQSPQPGTDESSPLSERQAIGYNNAKIAAEKALLKARAGGDVEVVILRPGIVFGPRSAWVETFARACIAGDAYLLDGGQGICNSIYVDNLIEAIHRALVTDAADGECFLVGDAEQVTWAQFYGPIAQSLGIDPSDIPAALPADAAVDNQDRLERILSSPMSLRILSRFPDRWRHAARAALNVLRPPTEVTTDTMVASLEMTLLQRCGYKLPHDKAASVLGYAPPVSFADGLCRTIDWLKFAGFRDSPWLDSIGPSSN